MANHQSAIKRIRQSEKRRVHNKYYAKTARNAVRKLRATSDKEAANELLPKVNAMLDKLAKINVIHKNKAANLKSKLASHVNKL
ncbi:MULTISPECIES: 30S ribosomal protein S20 [unclassified Marinifilum]|uniref:30S ribosomal protein S20 n=1 Tax=unclassified Marinifilum TaxID=2642519 RepID=UPI0022759556|nr:MULTISPECIES: 30S ribosomal protein S20 [unclassified Marinifilum]MCY1635131.1 30S ribosomal protein S20 [Marinifilum sp. D737]MDQ2180635.1 30S ribosomal protein S20 [Marinifilum sp. D714]